MGPPVVGQNDNFGGQYSPLFDDDCCDCCEGCGGPLLCSVKPPAPFSLMAPGDNRRDDDALLSSASDNEIAVVD